MIPPAVAACHKTRWRGTNQLRSFRGLTGCWPQNKNNISPSFPVLLFPMASRGFKTLESFSNWKNIWDKIAGAGSPLSILLRKMKQTFASANFNRFLAAFCHLRAVQPAKYIDVMFSKRLLKYFTKTILQLSIFHTAWPAQLLHQSAGAIWAMNINECRKVSHKSIFRTWSFICGLITTIFIGPSAAVLFSG